MKSEKIYDGITGIREELIEEAGKYPLGMSRKQKFMKWGSLVACFCLVILGMMWLGSGASGTKGDAGGVNNGSVNPNLQVLAYNGNYYNCSNSISVLNVAGIPEVITAEAAGNFLGYLVKTDNGYEEASVDTGIGIYEYAPAASNEAVVVIRDGEEYMAALFSNQYTPDDDNASSPISELYRIYGMETTGRIAMVAGADAADTGNLVGEKITDSQALEEFYQATMAIEEYYGRNDFSELVLNQMSEEDYSPFYEIEKALCIETAEGLRFFLNWYPESGWLYSSGTMTYYKIAEGLQDWLETYME